MRASGEAVELKIDLQSRGVRAADVSASGARRGGAGPADGITLFFDDLVTTVPTAAAFVERSPFTLQAAGDKTVLTRGGRELREVEVAGRPAFYSRVGAGGVPLEKVALRHGLDGIGSTVAQGCGRREPCLFCGISLSAKAGTTLARKSPRDVGDAAAAALDEGFSHVVLTTGTPNLDDCGIPLLASCAEAVKSRTGGKMKVHVQFEPPTDDTWIQQAAAFADTAAINMECFDAATLARVAPGKAALGPPRFERAWTRAVEAMGEGRVACFVIVGLGEPRRSVIEACRLLTSLGVFPYVLPLRPIPGTPLGQAHPPAAAEMLSLYQEAARVISASRISKADSMVAGCVRCGACSAITDVLEEE